MPATNERTSDADRKNDKEPLKPSRKTNRNLSNRFTKNWKATTKMTQLSVPKHEVQVNSSLVKEKRTENAK